MAENKSPRYLYYVQEIAKYRRSYNKNPNITDGEKIKILRYNALMENINLFELERDVFIEVHGRTPTDEEMKSMEPYIEEAYLTREMIVLRDTYNRTTDANLRAQLHEQAQHIRMQVYGLGVDPYRFENRVFELINGKPLEGQQRTNHYKYIDEAIAKYNSLYKTRGADSPIKPITEEELQFDKRVKVTRLDLGNRFNETFSGADMVVFFAFPGYKPIEIGVASTVSYSTYRETKQVRTCGRISAKGIVKGSRTVSGRLIFTVIREHVVEMIRREIPYLRTIKTILMDELPPFDILVSFGNEYGSSAGLVINGITLVDEQKTMSIEDLFTENIFTFIARDLQPMRDMNNIDRIYEPLEWFSTSFRAPGSEEIAMFQPKELQIYHDAQLLTDPMPFFGRGSGWDSSMYDWSELAKMMGIEAVVSTSQTSPSSKNTSLKENAYEVFVHAVVYTPNGYAPVVGNITLYANGKEIGKKQIGVHDAKSLGYTTYTLESNPKKQLFPIRFGSNVHGAFFQNLNIPAGVEIKAYYTPDSTKYYKAASSALVNEYGGSVLIVIKTELVGTGSENNPTVGIPKNINFVGISENIKGEKQTMTKDAYAIFSQTSPKKSNSGKKSLKEELNAIPPYPQTKALPPYIAIKITDDKNNPVAAWPVTCAWSLDLNKCSKTSNKYKAINQSVGLSSMSVATAWNKQKNKNVDDIMKKETDVTGEVHFDVRNWFFTLKKKSDGKYSQLKWSDLPEFAVLTFTFYVYESKVNSDRPNLVGTVQVAFVK